MTKTIKPKTPTADFWIGVDPEIAEPESGLLESMAQMKRGAVSRMHTPAMITGYKARSRPVASVTAEATHSPNRALQPRGAGPLQGIRQSLAGTHEQCAQGMATNAFPGLRTAAALGAESFPGWVSSGFA